MLQFLALAFLMSSTAAFPKLEANMTISCELSGKNALSAIAWSMDNYEDMRKYGVETIPNPVFYVNNGNEKQEPFRGCTSMKSSNLSMCTATGWVATENNAGIKPMDPFGPVLDMRWEGFLPISSNTLKKNPWTILGSGSISVLTNDTMTIQFNVAKKKQSSDKPMEVKIVLDEYNTSDTQNVSSVIYIRRDQNDNFTELKRQSVPVLDSKLWVHLTINISSTVDNKAHLQLFKYGMKDSLFNAVLESSVDQPVAMSFNLNGFHKKHQYGVKYTNSRNSNLEVKLKSGCWNVIYFGELEASFIINNSSQTKPLQYERKDGTKFSTYELILSETSTPVNVTFKPLPWYKSFWAIGDIHQCYSSRMRNLSGIPLSKISDIHCTSLLDGNSSNFTQTPFYVMNTTTIDNEPIDPQTELPVVEKSMMENKMWFYISATLLPSFLIILVVAAIKILQHFQICCRDVNEPFYRRRGSMLVAMKLESMKKRSNDAVTPRRLYTPTPGHAQEDHTPEDPDYDVIKVQKGDTLPAHVPRVPNSLAPPVPPVRPAHTFENPQYATPNDDDYGYLGIESKLAVKNKNKDLEGPEYGNFGLPSDKKIPEDEDPIYGNVVVPIPVKQIVVTADIEAPEYGNFGENIPKVQKVKEEPKPTYGGSDNDPIYGNF